MQLTTPAERRELLGPSDFTAAPHDGGERRPGAFSRLAICSRCLGETVSLAYCPGGITRMVSDSLVCHRDGIFGEHFHRTCTSCGHVWYERMLSAVTTI
jgi:hypothetical protein